MSIALTGKKKEEAEKFYDKLLKVLISKKQPFMVGGTYAFNEYTGLSRPTGDIDIKIPSEDYPTVLKTLSDSGYATELEEIDLNWLAKVTDKKGFYTDIIFGDRNGLQKINRSWFEYTRAGTVLGNKVKLEPIEEMIRSKLYVQNRHRADSGDVIHLILRQGKNIDWKLLLKKTEPHWELLLAHIIFFVFIYPSERNVIPKWIIDELISKFKKQMSSLPPKERMTRGLLLSDDYEVAVSQWGYKPITELK